MEAAFCNNDMKLAEVHGNRTYLNREKEGKTGKSGGIITTNNPNKLTSKIEGKEEEGKTGK